MASGALGITESTFGPGEGNSAPRPRNSASGVKTTKKAARVDYFRVPSTREQLFPEAAFHTCKQKKRAGAFPSRGLCWGSLPGRLIGR